jgi:hypothetical protein
VCHFAEKLAYTGSSIFGCIQAVVFWLTTSYSFVFSPTGLHGVPIQEALRLMNELLISLSILWYLVRIPREIWMTLYLFIQFVFSNLWVVTIIWLIPHPRNLTIRYRIKELENRPRPNKMAVETL